VDTEFQFPSSQLKIQNAIYHTHKIDEVLIDYGKRLTVSYEPVPGDPHHKRLTLSEPQPRQLPLVIGDAIHNFRSALDLMMCDIARRQLTDTALISKVAFPIADSLEKLDEMIASNKAFKQMDPAVLAAVRACRPYKGGDSQLYALHRLDIDDKHRLIIPTISVAWGLTVAEISALTAGATRDQMEWKNDVLVAQINGLQVTFVGEPLPTLDPEGALLDTATADLFYPKPFKSDLTPTALFAKDSELPGTHVLQGLDAMFKAAYATLVKFKAWA
jgi:hypothetical protein